MLQTARENKVMKRKFVLIFIILTSAVCFAEEQLVSEIFFINPEEAIEFFIDKLKNQDAIGALSTCAVNAYGEGFKFDEYANWLSALTPLSPAPSEYELYLQINKMQKMAEIARQIKFFIYSLLTPERDYTLTTMVDRESSEAKEIAESLDPERLSDLQIIDIRLTAPEIFNCERNLTNMKRRASFYGGETMTERVVLYKLGKQYFVGGITLIKFGKGWQIDGMYASLAGLNSLGMTEEIDRGDYRGYYEF